MSIKLISRCISRCTSSAHRKHRPSSTRAVAAAVTTPATAGVVLAGTVVAIAMAAFPGVATARPAPLHGAPQPINAANPKPVNSKPSDQKPADVKPTDTKPAYQKPYSVSHTEYDILLRKFVVKGFVDYDAFAADSSFQRYLTSLNTVRPETLSEDERLAFWINVYNAFTIQLIIAHGEKESIRNINQTFGVLRLKGPWTEPLVHAAGRTLTLDDVHHTILRKEFGEPRIHFALACGAISCPTLRSEAYTGALLVDQLNSQAHEFLRESPDKNSIDKRTVNLSPVITAYRNDFAESRQALGRALAEYFDGENRKMLEAGRFFIRDTAFDWTLNSMAKGKALGKL